MSESGSAVTTAPNASASGRAARPSPTLAPMVARMVAPAVVSTRSPAMTERAPYTPPIGRPFVSRAGNEAMGALIRRKCDACAHGGAPCAHCADEDGEAPTPVRRSAAAGAAPNGSSHVPASVRAVLGASGAPLSHGARASMEGHFGHGFGDVRVHTGTAAAESAAAVGAVAYTVGRHVVFGAGQFAPDTPAGARLLAHELTHVVQQQGAHVDLDRLALDGDVTGPAEREAEAMAAHVGGRGASDRSPSGTMPNAVPPVRLMRARIQRRMVEGQGAGGCGICHGPQEAGNIAHALIQAEFLTKAIDPNVLGKSHGSVRCAELDLTLFGASPGDDNGRLDLALMDAQCNLRIGEIKPANAAQLEQGRNDIAYYARAIQRHLGVAPVPLRESINMDFVIMPNPQIADCPEVQHVHLNPPVLVTPPGFSSPVGSVYTYYCTPTRDELWMHPECRCWPERRKKEKTKDLTADKPKSDDKDKRKADDPTRQEPPFDQPSDRPNDQPGNDRDRKPPTPPFIIDGPSRPTPPFADPPGPTVDVEGKPTTVDEPTGEPGGNDGKTDAPVDDPLAPPEGWTPPVQAPAGGDHALAKTGLTVAALGLGALAFGTIARGAAGALLKRFPGVAAAFAILAIIEIARGGKLSFGDSSGGGGGSGDKQGSGDKGGDGKTKLSDETVTALEKDPRVRDALTKASSGGDLSADAQQAMEEVARTIAEHGDEFTDEELKQLSDMADDVQQAVPQTKVSVDQIKQALKARREKAPQKTDRSTPSGGSGGGEGDLSVETPAAKPPADRPAPPKLSPELRKRLTADKAANALVNELGGEVGAGVPIDAAVVEQILALSRDAKLTEEDVKALADSVVTTTAKGAKAEDVLATWKAAIARRKASQTAGTPPTPSPTTPPATAPSPDAPTSGTPAPDTPAPAGGVGVGDVKIDIVAITDAAQANANEHKAEIAAQNTLADPSKYDDIKDGTFNVKGGIRKTIKIKSGDALPAVRVVGRQNGRLFTGAIVPVAVAEDAHVPGGWQVSTQPAPIYDADGTKIGVFGSHTFTLRVGGSSATGLTD